MNYLLMLGLSLFSSACGALLVALLQLRRREPPRIPPQSETDSRPRTVADAIGQSSAESAAPGTALAS